MALCSSLPPSHPHQHSHVLPSLAAIGLFNLPAADEHRRASQFRPVVLYAEQQAAAHHPLSLPVLSALAAAAPPVPLNQFDQSCALASLETLAAKKMKFTQTPQATEVIRRRRCSRVAWTEDEKIRFRMAIRKYDRCWKKVAEEMKTRNANQVYAYARWYFSKHPEERPPPSALARSPAARALAAASPANTRVSSRGTSAQGSNDASPVSSSASGLSSPVSSPASPASQGSSE